MRQVPPVSSGAAIQQQKHMQAWVNQEQPKNPILRFLGIQKKDERGEGGSSLIHPMSPFNIYIQMASCLLVVYSGVETPWVLAFQDVGVCVCVCVCVCV